jgi:hypothetical protein
MGTYHVEESAVIDAPPKRVYEIISDYHDGHPSILPSRYFSDLEVIEGGQGTGTMIKVTMNVFGAKALYQMSVSEPEPGRVLQEEDVEAGVRTTFTVDSVNGGKQSLVTIATEARTSPGLRGWIEKLVSPAITKRIYQEELAQLSTVVKFE